MTKSDSISEIRAELAAGEAKRETARFDPTFLDDLRQARDVQIRVWGDEHDRKHTPYDWVVFLTKFVGRVAVAAMRGDLHEFERELVKVAAVAAAAHRASYPADLVNDWSEDEVRRARALASRESR